MYLHEARLTEAIKKLYMLGNKKPHETKENIGESVSSLGGSLRSGVSSLASRQDAGLKERQKQAAIRNASQVNASRAGQAMTSGYGATAGAMANPLEQAKTQADVNDAARMAPIGGQFTKQGFDQHVKDRDQQTQDINQSRYMMRFGGMLNSLGEIGDF